MRPFTLFSFLLIVLLGSCVSKKKYTTIRASNETLLTKLDGISRDFGRCRSEKLAVDERVEDLEREIELLRETNKTLNSNVGSSVMLSAQQAANQSKLLESLREKDLLIRTMAEGLTRRDSLTTALVKSFKGSLDNIQDEDIEVNVEKGVVFISISDKLLFKSGSTVISDRARQVLAKVAQVVNDKPEMDFLIEGHTDNVPMNRDGIKDNWDLSVLRAAAIVRSLQKDHGVDPSRMLAGGRGEYVPLVDNSTAENKARNRRTRIVMLPKLDEFYKLIEDGLNAMETEGGR